jgi:hypothetical protein
MDIKNKHRFNLIDFFVILITLALIAGTIYFAWRENKELKAHLHEKNITYTLCLSGVDEDFISVFEAEAHVLNSSTLNYAGTIKKIKLEKSARLTDKAVQSSTSSAYIVVQEVSDELYDIYLTVSAKTLLDGRGVAYIDSQRITVGTPMYIRCENFTYEAFITSFSIN